MLEKLSLKAMLPLNQRETRLLSDWLDTLCDFCGFLEDAACEEKLEVITLNALREDVPQNFHMEVGGLLKAKVGVLDGDR